MKYKPDSTKLPSTTHDGEKGHKKQTVVEGSGKLDFGEYELELWDLRYTSLLHTKTPTMQEGAGSREEEGRGRSKRCGNSKRGTSALVISFLRPSFLPVTIVVTLSFLIIVMAMLDGTLTMEPEVGCEVSDDCRFQLVESIPENLTYVPGSVAYPSIYEGWVSLIDRAESSIDIAAFYWTLLNDDVTDKPILSSWQGEDIFRRLNDTGLSGNVRIRIAQNAPSFVSPQNDSAMLASAGAAQVRSLDFNRLVGGGVLHTKLWVVDGRHLYIGSANMDWRSLTQVKEVGVVINNCSCLANDIKKIFEVYWHLGEKGAIIPSSWPEDLQTAFNMQNQMSISLSGATVNTYLSSSPPPFCPKGRSNDIDAILDVIDNASRFVYIAVMDYFPIMLYGKHKKFWPAIDERLRAAAWERGVTVRVLGSYWSHTRPDMPAFLQSLQDLSGNNTGMTMEAKLFVVPSFTKEQEKIPFARVNHNKYMVTDSTAYIGTSNWSEDYFLNTGGVGLVVNETASVNNHQTLDRLNMTSNQADSTSLEYTADLVDSNKQSLRAQLQALFERDWDSEYARPLKEFL